MAAKAGREVMAVAAVGQEAAQGVVPVADAEVLAVPAEALADLEVGAEALAAREAVARGVAVAAVEVVAGWAVARVAC